MTTGANFTNIMQWPTKEREISRRTSQQKKQLVGGILGLLFDKPTPVKTIIMFQANVFQVS